MNGKEKIPTIKEELLNQKKFLLKSLEESYLELTAKVIFINQKPVDKIDQERKDFLSISQNQVDFNRNTMFDQVFNRRMTS